jgi:superfamily II DNA or RNA helicase
VEHGPSSSHRAIPEISLRHPLRDYQERARAYSVEFVERAEPGDKLLLAAPTGTGKSLIIAALFQSLSHGVAVITPRVEIIIGLLRALGQDLAGLSAQHVRELAERIGIFTPIRFRNLLAAGQIAHPRVLLADEVHHATCDVCREIDVLANHPVMIGFTATPFRGTPRGTAELYEYWGEPVYILTERQAVDRGVVAVPTCSVLGLVDDDVLDTSGGDFVVTPAGDAICSRLDDLIAVCRRWVADELWDRASMFAFPSVASARDAAQRFNATRIPVVLVTGETPLNERLAAFRQVVERRAALMQVGIVNEGVDIPELRRLIDCRPTLSPVLFVQTLGRIRRPGTGEAPPEYICTNRNLERHAYLFEGILPSSVIAEAQASFSRPSKRAGIRVVGLEGLGRFRATELPLAGGLTGVMYAFSALRNNQVTEYAVLMHPARMTPTVATRRNQRRDDGTRAYGRWVRLPELPAITDGFASLAPTEPSKKQRAWWRRDAARRGLDPTAKVNRRNFAALPVLSDLNMMI